jgi:hypothetical protein
MRKGNPPGVGFASAADADTDQVSTPIMLPVADRRAPLTDKAAALGAEVTLLEGPGIVDVAARFRRRGEKCTSSRKGSTADRTKSASAISRSSRQGGLPTAVPAAGSCAQR